MRVSIGLPAADWAACATAARKAEEDGAGACGHGIARVQIRLAIQSG